MPYEIVIYTGGDNTRFDFQTREELDSIIKQFDGQEYSIYNTLGECVEYSKCMDSHTGECLPI